jgi:hypothetical protein
MSLPAPGPDRTCLVTGASSGIGAEIARDLARRGHGVTLVARREAALAELAAELTKAHKVRVEVLPCDLTDADARAALADHVAELGLTVDVLVNNAGLSTIGPAKSADRAGELRMLHTNIDAVVDLCVTFLPGMVARRRGAIMNTASVGAFQPLPGQAGYAATKAFVLSYGRAIGEELKGTGVTVTTLCPGPVDTNFAEAAGFDAQEAEASLPKFMWETPEAVAKAGVAGMDKGTSVVIPGPANYVAAIAGHLTPKKLLLPILKSQHPALKGK